MRLADFIKSNRTEIERCINAVRYRHDGNGGRGTIPEPAPRYSMKECREWVLNDEGLYHWARIEGCRV